MFLLSLALLAPIYISGLYLLFKDDQIFILDSIRKKKRAGYFGKEKGRLLTITLATLIIVSLLKVTGAKNVTIFFPLISLGIYIYWEIREPERIEKKRRELSEAEFPAMVELIAVLIAAGEPPIRAIQRVGERSVGVLANDFLNVIKKIEAGAGLSKSLELLSSTTSSDSIRRFSDTLILALERGTSLSDVLARQVQEIRNEHQTRLIEEAGKAEISLMIPVIFLILPISILFALWPSYLALGQSVFG